MKRELQHPKSGSCKQKTKGTVGAEASHNKMAKQTKIDKGENIKSLSSVKANLKRLNTKLMTKKSKEINLDSVRSKGEKSRKRKKEEEQKKPKSNSSISVKTSKKKPSNGTAAQNSVKRGKTTSKSEQGKKKKQKESGSHEELKPKNPNSKVEARAKNHDSFSMGATPSGSKDQTQNGTLKTRRLSSHAHSFKIHQTHMDAGKQKNSKATKHEVLTSLVEKSRDPSLRRLKILRALGLLPPAASPFVRTGALV